mgnify:CR=1 FL=1
MNGNFSQKTRRLIATVLLASNAYVYHLFKPVCPVWQAGFPCPACGTTRAVNAIIKGNIRQAFAHNLFFLYWIALIGSIGLGFVGFILGRLPHPELIGNCFMNRVSTRIHFIIWLSSLTANLYRLGLNSSGWLFKIFKTQRLND